MSPSHSTDRGIDPTSRRNPFEFDRTTPVASRSDREPPDREHADCEHPGCEHPMLYIRRYFTRDDALPLAEDSVTVGRHRDCSVVVDDIYCSRVHCRLKRIDGAWYVFHLSRTNATLVNGQEVRVHPHRLQNGDLIGIGVTALQFFDGALQES